MTRHSDQGAAGARAIASILFVVGVFLLFVIFAFGIVSLQLCFNACHRRRRAQGSMQSAWRRRGAGRTALGRGGSTQTRVGDPEAPLRSLPATVYRAAEARPSKEEECAVCLAELEDGEAARLMPCCGHGFHAQCVDTWLASHSTCPLCRNTVARPDTALAPASALRPVPPEPANYAAANLPERVSNQGAMTVTPDRQDRSPSPSTTAVAVLVIAIPELAVPTAIPRDPGHQVLRVGHAPPPYTHTPLDATYGRWRELVSVPLNCFPRLASVKYVRSEIDSEHALASVVDSIGPRRHCSIGA
jgi:E3 ubiquitin-protein ligase EL5